MVQIYREILVETVILVLLGGSLVFFPLYFNMYTVSLHLIGPKWDFEVSVLGTSMYPALISGDFICVDEVNASLVKASPSSGDIVVFQRPNASILQSPPIVTHRAIDKAVRNGITYFQTKGDNNDSPDQWSDNRGENYTWNGMFSELLLMGKVVGVRKDSATVFPMAVMAILLVSVIVTDIVVSAWSMHRNTDSKATASGGRQS